MNYFILGFIAISLIVAFFIFRYLKSRVQCVDAENNDLEYELDDYEIDGQPPAYHQRTQGYQRTRQQERPVRVRHIVRTHDTCQLPTAPVDQVSLQQLPKSA